MLNRKLNGIINHLDSTSIKSSSHINYSDTREFKWDHLRNIGFFDNIDLIKYPDSYIDLMKWLIGLGYSMKDYGVVFSASAQLWAVASPLVEINDSTTTNNDLSGYINLIKTGDIISSHAITEPSAGGTLSKITTTLNNENNNVVITGKKTWITNAQYADVFLVVGSRNTKLGIRGLSAVLVPKDKTITIDNIPFDALEDTGMAEITFSKTVIPENMIIHKNGAHIFNTSMIYERSFILLPLIGCVIKSIEDLMRYHESRGDHGSAILNNYMNREKLGDIILEINSVIMLCESLLTKFTDKSLNYKDHQNISTQIKLIVSEKLKSIMDTIISLAGAYGLASESNIWRTYKACCASTIFSGTSSINKLLLSF